jgi:hypothetical protein
MDDDSFERRAAQRSGWLIRRYALGSEPSADPHDSTTMNARLDMMWQLALDAWAFTGRPIPSYERSQAPGAITRKAHAESSSAE